MRSDYDVLMQYTNGKKWEEKDIPPETLDLARNIVKGRGLIYQMSSFPLNIIGKLLMKEKRYIPLLWYSYLRWIDDFIDDPNIPRDRQGDFLAKQNLLQEQFYRGCIPNLVCSQERIALFFVMYDLTTGKKLRKYTQQWFDLFKDDLQYRGQSRKQKELEEYSKKTAEAYFRIVMHALDFEKKMETSFFLNLGKAAVSSKNLCNKDIQVDTEVGDIRVSKEDITSFKLDVRNLHESPNFEQYRKDKAAEYLDAMRYVKKTIQKFPLAPRILLNMYLRGKEKKLEIIKNSHLQ